MSDEKDLSWFSSTSHADASYQVSSQLAFRFRRRSLEILYIQDSGHGGHLGFLIGTILTFFIFKSLWCFLPSFSNQFAFWFRRWSKKIKFSRCQSSWLSNQNDFSCFDLLVTSMLPVKFQDIWLSFQEERRKIDFQDGGHGGYLGFPIKTISLFLSTSHPDASYQVSSLLAFCLRRRREKSQNGGHGGHLGLRIGTILNICALQDTPMLPTKFQVSCLQKKKQIRLSR